MAIIKFVSEKKEIQVPDGSNLRKEALRAGVGLYPGINKVLNCHGFGSCGSCRVLITKGMENASPMGFIERMRLKLSMAYGHQESFADALRNSEGVFADFIWLLKRAVSGNPRLRKIALGAPPSDNPEIRIEQMRTAVSVQTVFISQFLSGFPGIDAKTEERYQQLAYRAMKALGDLLRENRRILVENWPYSWSDGLELEFKPYMRMGKKASKKRKSRRRK